jgi:hypothetical protein
MAAQTDLWGEILPATERTPVSILREQAALLGQKTKNLVEAKVETMTMQDGKLIHSFTLVAPALGNYRFQLFQVYHSLTSLYPLRVSDKKEELPTEKDFVAWLGSRLSSPDTKKLIGNLLAQVTT